jgi:hypothetical protein
MAAGFGLDRFSNKSTVWTGPIASRMKAAGIHLAASALVAALASLLVFLVWYPIPFAAIAGGTHLFVILISVDVVMGPALTAVIADARKRRAEFIRDLAVIVALQISAFAYGLFTMAMARPVHLAFEVDLFRVVSAVDIETEMLKDAPPDLQELSWTGPTLIAAVKPSDPSEQLKSIDLGMAGINLADVPRNWRHYSSARDAVWSAARPMEKLLARYPNAAEVVSQTANSSGLTIEALRFLPVVSRHRSDWIAVLAGPDARVVAYLQFDGFL